MNVFILPIEPIDQRYTAQWYDNIPKMLEENAKKYNMDVSIVTIDGQKSDNTTTAGAFLNFASTNTWRADQVTKLATLFVDGSIKSGDQFLVTDAWNFVITPLKYMSELLDIPINIHCIWHAGHYDPSDILGMKMSDQWPYYSELSWFHACDYNYFGTRYHRDMFLKNLNIPKKYHKKTVVCGQPHEYIIPYLKQYESLQKKKRIIWPHRYNSDKQPEIAEEMSNDYEVLITQKDKNLSKHDYYDELGDSQIIFSCSLHENLGISVMEGVLADVIPVVPDRCSYSEMYDPIFLYPSKYTSSLANFHKYKKELFDFINERMYNPEKYYEALQKQKKRLISKYLTSDLMIARLLKIII